MILKSLTLQGFKSFAQRVTLELPRGVAAVVGPNGSGKSNIADAIRWALGEQSIRVLRGARLEDVIFVGSDSRRPAAMAEVSLTFDNSDGTIPLEYTEVCVTRRVYRSGESEFLINRRPCRLKDIQELFMDTGVGRGSLAIIGQGEVDAVLSARPEERRAFLEEAAGISRYRHRKSEALERLARTEESLVRLADIIAEVERQLQPLAEQAERAKRHAALSEQLWAAEGGLLLLRFERLEAARRAAQGRVEQIEKERDAARAAALRLEEEIRAFDRALDEVDAALNEARRRAERAREQQAEARHRLEMAQERWSQSEREEAERRARLQGLAARRSALEEELQAALASRRHALEELEKAEAAVGEATQRLEALRARIGQRGLILEKERRRAEELRRELARVQAEREALGERVALLQRESEALTLSRQELVQEAQAAQEELSAAQERLRSLDEALTKARGALEELQKSVRALEAERDGESERHRAELRRQQELRARRQALEEMEEAREGYQQGVRAVLRAARERGWDLRGAVAELFRVPKQYETAVEVALGGAQQFVIAARDDDAKAAIQFLKERRLGRATFLPLASLRPLRLPAEALRRLQAIDGAIGLAADLVEVDEALRPAVLYLLGRVAVARDLDAAVALARGVRGLSRVVTLDGDVVVPGGAMTGGSQRERSDGLLGRRRRLEELTERIVAGEAVLAESEKRLAQIDAALERARAQVRAAEDRRRQLELERVGASRDVQEAKARCQRAEQAKARWEAEVARRRRELEEAAAQLAAAAEREQALADQEQSLSAALASREEGARGERQAEEELRDEVGRLQLALVRARQACDQHARELERLERERAQILREEEAEKERLGALAGERGALREAIAAAHEVLAAGAEAAQKAEEETEAFTARRDELRRRRDETAQRARQVQERIGRVQETLARAQVELDRREQECARLQRELEERGLARSAAPSATEGSEAELERLCRSLRAQIEALGPVNPGSIAEYEAVKERHAFLTGQRQDLEQAKEQLHAAIARIDKESRAKFDALFRAVQEAFERVFTRLFGGGTARLSLVDPDDPLESGVEIFVQPPGKRLQNLVALSGGERALAAIALLFALLSVRPSPFCVLDEIDAALDEHNLVRFRQLLGEFSGSTQFLVITHRQGTMEGADCLFGVTMEESGVSRLVSLSLDDVRTA